MIVQFKPSALGQTRWYEYLVRFVLGGAMTIVAGLIAARFGPVIGGLFLAFPAIFPASATLIEKHVRERKEDRKAMDMTTLLIIVVIVLLLGGGGFYGRGRWW